MKNQTKAYFYTFLAIICWSTVATAFKISLKYLTPTQLLLFATFSSTFILFWIIFFQGKLVQIRKFTLKQFFLSGLLGFINPFVYYLILFEAYNLLPAQIAQPLNCTWGIILVLLSIPLLNQKIGLHSIFAILISFLGVVIISTGGDFQFLKFVNSKGIFLALLSAILWALFWIFNLKDKRDEAVKLFCNFFFGSIFILIYSMIFSEINFKPIKGIMGAFYVGFFEMGITFFLWLKALQLSESTAKISNYIYIFPFISLIFIHFILGEKIMISSFIGLIFITIGILFHHFMENRKGKSY